MIPVFGRSVARYSRHILSVAFSLGLTAGVRAALNGDAEVSDAGSSAGTAAIITAAASTGNRTVVTGDGAGSGSSLNTPTLVTVAPNGTAYYYETLASGTNNCIVSVNPASGARAVVSGGGTGSGPAFVALSGMAWDLATSSLIVSDSGSSASTSGILSVDPVSGNRTEITGNGAGSGAAISNPQFVTVAGNGTIYYYETDLLVATVRGVVSVNPANGARVLVSGGSPVVGTGADFQAVTGFAWDLSNGTLVASDAGSSSADSGIIRIDPATGNRAFVTGDSSGSGVNLDIPESVTVTTGGTIYYIEEDASGAANSVVSVNPASGARSILSGSGVGAGAAFVAPTWVTAADLAPQISDQSLAASGTVGVGFSTYTITAIDSPASFSASGLPAGLLVNTSTGQITGTPTQAGTFNVTIGATNSVGTGTATLVITISQVTLIVSPGTLPGTSVFATYLQTITASGGTAPYTFAVTSGTPVPGLLLSSGGVLSGSATTAGIFMFTVTATDSSTGAGAPFTGSQSYTVAVAQASQTINFPAIGSVTEGLAHTLSATSSSGLPVTFAVQSGDATITGGTTLKILNLLPVTIVASQAGNATYAPAANVTQTVTATPARTTTRAVTPGSGTPGASGSPQVSTATLLAVTPAAQTVGAGTSPTLSVSASGSVQWLFNGAPVAGATGPTLTLSSIGTNQAGTYTAVVTNPDGSVGTGSATVAVTADARLIDASARAYIGAGDDAALLTGFVVAGSNPEQLLIRGIGPTLAKFQVSGALAAPELSLYDADGGVVASGSAWGAPLGTGSSPVAASVHAASSDLFARLDIFGLPAGSSDCALVADLPAGQYTAKLTGLNQSTGVAMAELTDAGGGTTTSRLTNVSARAQVGTGSSVLVAGFVISGTTSETILIRGVGPALGAFGVTGTLAAPQLTLFDSSGGVIATNTGWSNASVLGGSNVGAGVQPATSSVMASVSAFALAAGSADSAIVVTLPPGAYTAQVSGANNTSGAGLIELYDVPPAP